MPISHRTCQPRGTSSIDSTTPLLLCPPSQVSTTTSPSTTTFSSLFSSSSSSPSSPFTRSSHHAQMAGSRLSGPPSYYDSYPFASQTSEKNSFVYNCQSDPAAMASSTSLSNSSDPRAADIKHWSGTLERMQDARLDKQRYIMSGHKSEEVSMLALSAKVERALARRMVGQDASFRPRDSSTTQTANIASNKKLDSQKRKPQVKAT